MKYYKKDNVVCAVQYTGENQQEVYVFGKDFRGVSSVIIKHGRKRGHDTHWLDAWAGNMLINPADWGVKNVCGEFFVFKDKDFKGIYEQIFEVPSPVFTPNKSPWQELHDYLHKHYPPE